MDKLNGLKIGQMEIQDGMKLVNLKNKELVTQMKMMVSFSWIMKNSYITTMELKFVIIMKTMYWKV